jgi:hypothetical protein
MDVQNVVQNHEIFEKHQTYTLASKSM